MYLFNLKGFKKKIIVLILFLYPITLCSCFSFKTKNKDGNSVSHHFGYARFEVPSTVSKNTNEDFKVNEIRTWGIRVKNGFGIGYSSERNEYIPLDGRLVIRVTNKDQIPEVLNILKNLDKEGLCITVDKND